MTTTMPCVDGESLPQYVARTGKLPAMQALAFAGQLLAALDRAHRLGLAYPGYTADDLLVMPNGRLALTAWGTVQRSRPALQTAMDDDLATAAAIAYELMAGRRTGVNESGARTGWFPPSHAGLPLAIDAVFERALLPEPHLRYATAAALWQALWTAMGPPVWERQVKKPLVLDEPPREHRVARAQHARSPERRMPTPERKSRRFAFALAGAAAVACFAVAAAAIASRALAPVEPRQAEALAPAADIDALLDREVPPPREELVAGSAAVLEPRDAVQPTVEPTHEPPRQQARQRQPRATPAPAVEAARPASRAEPPRTVAAARTSTPRRQHAAQRDDPNLGCDQAFVITREWCKVSKCETDAYSRHPVCKAMREEQRRRNMVADQAMRTR